jgi:aldehyde:ferredoxin oxidoreductase
LGPDNALVVGVGPLGGTSISSGRTELTAKSPETGLLGSSNFGGSFGAEVKFAGYDNIVITGKAEKPVYIWIDNAGVEIRDASAVWGRDSYETPGVIRQEVGNPEARIACIGQGGENLVRFASVQHEQGHGAGRTGMGAVMGSKNLKAIAVRGTNGLNIADPEAFLTAAGKMEEALRNNEMASLYRERGNARTQNMGQLEASAHMRGMLGVGDDTRPESLPDMGAIAEKHSPKKAGCFGCPVQCMDQYDDVEGVGGGTVSCMVYVDLFYACRCYDADAVLQGGILCQKYGIDVTSTTQMIRWLMELYEAGVITKEDTDGVAMEWGSPEAILAMIEKTAHREGIGDVLAEGSLRAAEKIGRGSMEYVNQVKGLAVSEVQNPNNAAAYKGTCLSDSVSPRGDNMRALSYPIERYEEVEDPEKLTIERKRELAQCYEGEAECVVSHEDLVLLCDMLSICKYTTAWWMGAVTLEHMVDLYSAGSGTEASIETLVEQAGTIRTLERAIDVREGLTREMETLPRRFFNKNEPIREGPYKGNILDSKRFEEMKSEYYELRAWDPLTGVPTEETLGRFGLEDVAEDLRKRGRLPTAAQ